MAASAPASPIPVWLDCDPGHDDFMAILLILGLPRALHLVGISTVHGNMPIECTTTNALRALHVGGRLGDVPVLRGAERPLLRAAKFCPEVHGATGIDGFDFPALPDGTEPLAEPAIVGMHRLIAAHHARTGEKVTLVVTGCQTNIALLLRVFPDVVSHVQAIYFMGGAIGAGNTSPAAEFNIEIDPEAAAIVLDSGLPIFMVPLEVTHTALVTDDVRHRIFSLGAAESPDASSSSSSSSSSPPSPSPSPSPSTPSTFSTMAVSLMDFFRSTYRDVFGMPDAPLHDPCAVVFLLHPEWFESKLCRVDIETGSALCAGRTVVDLLNIRAHPASRWNVTVATKMEVPRFWDLMLEALDTVRRVSPLH